MGYSVSFVSNRLSIAFRRRLSLFMCLFYPFWAAGWITLAIAAPPQKAMPTYGLILFGCATVLFGYHWLLKLWGREELEFAPSELIYRRILLGVSRMKIFKIERIVAPHFEPSRRKGMSGGTPSGLAFSYDGKEVRVCDGITQGEARALVSAIVQKAPEHAECWRRYEEGYPELNEFMTLDLK